MLAYVSPAPAPAGHRVSFETHKKLSPHLALTASSWKTMGNDDVVAFRRGEVAVSFFLFRAKLHSSVARAWCQ